MPYNNEYNRSISRDIDYFNKRYIAHCDSTGTGTQNYRVLMATGLSGGGAGCAEFNGDSSDDENVGSGGAILGLQAGTILGGPKSEDIPNKKQISSHSALGAPIGKNASEEINKNNVPNATPDAPPPPPAAGAPPPKAGGAILGLHPYSFPAPPMTRNRVSRLTQAIQPPIGRMYRAGKFVSVRDIGDDDDGPYNHQYKKSRYESDSSSSESSSDSESDKEGGYCGDLPTTMAEAPRGIGAGKPIIGDTAKGSFNLERFADVGLKAMDKYDAGDEDINSEDEDAEEREERKEKKIGGYLDLAKKCHEMIESRKVNGKLEGSGMLSMAAKGARLAARYGMKAAKAAAKAAAKGAKAAAKGAQRGAKAAAKVAQRGAKAAAKGVAKGAKAAARAAKRGARAVKQAATKASKATKGRFGNVVSDLATTGLSELAKMSSKGDEEGKYDYEEEEVSDDERDHDDEEEEEEEEEEPDYEAEEKDADRADAEEEEEGEDDDDDDGDGNGNAPKGMDQKEMMKSLEGKLSGNKDQKGPKWLKDAKETQQTEKKPVDNVLGFDIFSKTPEADFVALFGDQYGNVEGKAITEIISGLQADGLKKEDIQKLLSQSQGALKTMAAKDVSETLKQKYDARQDFGNKNKNTSCMDAFNNVASKSETAQKDVRPTRKNDTYFGTGAGKGELSDVSKKNMGRMQKEVNQKGKESSAVQDGLKFVKAVAKNKQGIIDQIRKEKGLPPQLPAMEGGFFKETLKATRGVQQVMVPKAQMVSSTMSGMGKPKKGKKLKPESEMQGSNMSGMGKPKKANPRAEIVKKVMAEKGLSMIEASKYVKANNLYKK